MTVRLLALDGPRGMEPAVVPSWQKGRQGEMDRRRLGATPHRNLTWAQADFSLRGGSRLVLIQSRPQFHQPSPSSRTLAEEAQGRIWNGACWNTSASSCWSWAWPSWAWPTAPCSPRPSRRRRPQSSPSSCDGRPMSSTPPAAACWAPLGPALGHGRQRHGRDGAVDQGLGRASGFQRPV